MSGPRDGFGKFCPKRYGYCGDRENESGSEVYRTSTSTHRIIVEVRGWRNQCFFFFPGESCERGASGRDLEAMYLVMETFSVLDCWKRAEKDGI